MEIIHIFYDRGLFHGSRFPASNDSDSYSGRNLGALEGMDQWQRMDALTWRDNRGNPCLLELGVRGCPVCSIGHQPR